jgi:mRNA interferase MazF
MIKNMIVLVPFPFDDLTSTKIRPVVCLTDRIGPHNHVVVTFITSKIPADLLDTDIVIEESTCNDFQQTGLKVSSTIRLHRMMTIAASMIRRELGRLPENLNAEIDDRLVKLFKLKR